MLKIEPITIGDPGHRIPALRIRPPHPLGAAIMVHGYGGRKEEQVGLGWHVAQAGLVVDCVDLRGHGEHPLPFDDDVLDDVNAAIHQVRRFGKVACIGHSLGGRLALVSDADFTIGISPPLDGTNSARTEELLRKLKGHRVRTASPRQVFDMLAKLPHWDSSDWTRWMIVYGSKDVPEILASCERLRSAGPNVLRVEGAMHADTYLMRESIEGIRAQLGIWFQGAH
ncbi:MAG: alpha/beta fold hydrolase [Methanomassiliicoccales archaeon]|nr:alpha/beta fold hydrolase [Methanomassiliicoccales archaeon]